MLVNYHGPNRVSGNAEAVVQIHQLNRRFDFLGMVAVAALIGVVCALTTALVIFAPSDRGFLIWAVAIVSWILAIGLGGFTAFQIRVSSREVQISGGERAPSVPQIKQKAAP